MAVLDLTVNSRGMIKGFGDAKGASADFKKGVKRNLTSVDGYAKKTTGAFDKLKSSIFSVKGAIVSLGAGMLLKKSLDEFEKFETALTDMGKVTERSFQLIRKEIMTLPAELGSATQLMKGYYNVISAGVEGTAKQLDTLVASSKAAKAAHIDQGLAISGLTSVVDAYEGAVKNAAEAADLLFTIEKQGKTTVAELIPYIGQLSSASVALGISQQELGASFAQITKFSGGTSLAATQYLSVLTGLMKPTKDMIALFKDYGGTQEAIQKLGFEGTLRKIQEATGGSAEKLSALLGRQEALLGFLSLAKQDFAGLTTNVKAFNDSAGAMDKAWQDYQKTWASVKETFYNTIGKFAIEFVEEMAPDMKKGLEGLSDWMSDHKGEMVTGFKDIGNAVGTLSEAIGGIVSITSTFSGSAKSAIWTGIVSRFLFGSIPLARTASNYLIIAGAIDGVITSLTGIRVLDASKKGYLEFWEQWKSAIEQVRGNVTQFIKDWGNLKINLSDPASFGKTYKAIQRIVKGYYNVVEPVKMTREELEKINQMEISEGMNYSYMVMKRFLVDGDDIADKIQTIREQIAKGGEALGKTNKITSTFGDTAKSVSKQVKELAAEIAEANEEIESGLYQSDWEMIGGYQLFAGYEQAARDYANAFEDANRTVEETTKDATEKVWTLWDESLNRVQIAFADTFYDAFKVNLDGSLSILESFLNSMIRIVSEKLGSVVMQELFGVVSGAQGGLTGTGSGGGYGSLMDWLGLAKSGYESYSGKSLIGSLYEAVMGPSSSTVGGATMSGELMGSGSGGTGTSLFSGSTMFGSGIGSGIGTTGAVGGGTMGGAGTAGGMGSFGSTAGSSAGGAAAGGIAAVAMVIFSLVAANMQKQAGGPSKLGTESRLVRSDDPNRLFTGEMYNVFTTHGEWDEAHATEAAERIAGDMAETIDVYNLMFASVNEAAQAEINAAMDKLDIENMEFNFAQWAMEGGPITGYVQRNTPNEIATSEWKTIEDILGSTQTGEDGMDRFPAFDDAMKTAIVSAFEEGGNLAGEELAKIMGVKFETLEKAFATETGHGLKEFIEKMRQAYIGGSEVVGAGEGYKTIPEGFQKVFGDIFEKHISEALENIKAGEVFGMMTDEIQAAVESLDVDMFINDINQFNDVFTENVFQVERASAVWGSLNAFVGRATDEITAYERAATKAQIEVAAYTQMMAGFGMELSEEDTANKLKEVISRITDGVIDLEEAVKPLGQMGQLFATLKGQFSAYLTLLEEYGVDLSKITELKQLELEATKRLLNEYKIMIGLFGTDFAKTLRLDEIAERYKEFGLTHEQMIEAFRDISLTDLKAIADSLGIDWTDIADDIGFLVTAIGYVSDAALSAAANFTALRETLVNTMLNFGGGASQDPASLMALLTEARATPLAEMTPEKLQEMADLLVQWYNASAAQLEEEARQAEEEIRLLEQVVDRISSLVSQIDQTIRNIKYSDLNVSLPYQKAAEAQQDYGTLLSAAQTGGTAEIQEYLGFVQTYLKMQQDEYKSSITYQGTPESIYERTMADMEAIKAKAEAGGYDAQILTELTSGNEEIHADLSGIQATFAEFEGWILNAFQTLEGISLILSIDWDNWDGDMADALEMLLKLVDVYGWDHEYTLKFLAEVPLDIFEDLDDLAMAAGWIADQSGGWNSTATIAFVKNVAENWEFENIDEILFAAGYVAQQGGGWGEDVSIAFMATLMDRYNVPIADMPGWLDQMGLTDLEIPDVMAKLILQAYGGPMPIDEIDDYLTTIGITDADITRNIKVSIIYDMYTAGDISEKEIADDVHKKGLIAYMADQYDPGAIDLLKGLAALGKMWGFMSPSTLGAAVNLYGGYSDPASVWEQAWNWHGQTYARGGIVNDPTLGLIGEAGYPEAVIPMMDGYNIPVKWVNGGSTQQGAKNGEEVALLKEQVRLLSQIASQSGEFKIKGLGQHSRAQADTVIIERNKAGKLESAQRYYR